MNMYILMAPDTRCFVPPESYSSTFAPTPEGTVSIFMGNVDFHADNSLQRLGAVALG